jgi:NTP pyrophosphatase (non-canonical NTP hydrolase)
LNLEEYTKFTLTTAQYPGAGTHSFEEIVYLTLGLASESGEVAGKLKKIIRGDRVEPEAFVSEVGDVLWYLVRICDNLNISLEQLADLNVSKLSHRVADNTIKGDGDVERTNLIQAA